MQAAMKTSFNIESKVCPSTKEPFGAKYKGQFSIRRPSLEDKRIIGIKNAATLSQFGPIAPGTLSEGTELTNYIFSFMSVAAEGKLPEWFDLAKMYDDTDEEAVYAVWEEVTAFLATFRRTKDSGGSAEGSKDAAVLVPEQVQPSAQ